MAMPHGEVSTLTELSYYPQQIEIPASVPYQPERPRHLRLLPPIVEAPSAPEITETVTPDPLATNIMFSVIYAAVRGEYSNVESEAFLSRFDAFAVPHDPDEAQTQSVHPYHTASSIL